MRFVSTRSARTAVAVLAALLLAACGGGDGDEARDGTPTTSSPATDGPVPTGYPDFAPQDYTYRLEVLCFCPLAGPLAVTVADGAVTSATSIEGDTKGEEAPDFARLTINDIIDRANDENLAKVEVVWPSGQDHPDRVAIDQIERATDDEVTYTISDVQVR